MQYINGNPVPDHDKYGFLGHLWNTIYCVERDVERYNKWAEEDWRGKRDQWLETLSKMEAALEIRLLWWKQAVGFDYSNPNRVYFNGKDRRAQLDAVLAQHGLTIDSL
jgi:hypothetical protein